MFQALKEKIQGKGKKIVFPEGEEPRILKAVVRLKKEQLVEPILLGKIADIKDQAAALNLDVSDMEMIDPSTYEAFDEMVDLFVERRKGKVSAEDARQMLLDVNYFGTMIVYMDLADGLVSGAVHSTGETVRPALQIIKTAPDNKVTSGAMVMVREDERYIFADCALNIDPDPETLADIAIQSAKTAEIFDIDPEVALLSFSSKGSAKAPAQEKVAQATKIAQEKAPDHYHIDGELQFDAAFVPTVAKLKAPNSTVAGQAKVFVFPEIQSGNIGYKIAQRLGGFEAIGPILQGMAKPVSDLSRGCSEEDVYKIAIITANQAL